MNRRRRRWLVCVITSNELIEPIYSYDRKKDNTRGKNEKAKKVKHHALTMKPNEIVRIYNNV